MGWCAGGARPFESLSKQQPSRCFALHLHSQDCSGCITLHTPPLSFSSCRYLPASWPACPPARLPACRGASGHCAQRGPAFSSGRLPGSCCRRAGSTQAGGAAQGQLLWTRLPSAGAHRSACCSSCCCCWGGRQEQQQRWPEGDSGGREAPAGAQRAAAARWVGVTAAAALRASTLVPPGTQ